MFSQRQRLKFISAGEKKDFEVYSCDVSPDGSRLVTAAGGTLPRSLDGGCTSVVVMLIEARVQMAMFVSGLPMQSVMPATLNTKSPNSSPL